MLEAPRNRFNAAQEYQPMLRAVGLDAEMVFRHPQIKVWRKLEDRENCTLDGLWPDGRAVRLHIKRYAPARGFTTPADDEAKGIRALSVENIPTAPLVGWGKLIDGRSFVITEALAGYCPADKVIEEGLPFSELAEPTADLAAKLHNAGLHHRDLYLCHFFVKTERRDRIQLSLIDAARVRRLPGWPMRNRWIVKDLAQFWYSGQKLAVAEAELIQWLERYAAQRKISEVERLQRAVERKARWIAQHDVKLNEKQPTRNISIP
jgi:hypothetical protein